MIEKLPIRARLDGALLAQIALGAIALVLLAGAWLPQPLWLSNQRPQAIVLLIACLYVAAVIGLRMAEREDRRTGLLQIAIAGAVAAAPVLLAVLLLLPDFSRTVLIVSAVVGFVMAWVTVSLRARPPVKFAALGLLVLCGIAAQVMALAQFKASKNRPPSVAQAVLTTSLYDLSVTTFRNYVGKPKAFQGGIARFGNRYLLTTGDGSLYAFNRKQHAKELELQLLAYKVPLNSAQFAAAGGIAVNPQWFRVSDVLAIETQQGLRVFAFHHIWKNAEQCYAVRVSSLEGPMEAFLNTTPSMDWQTVFESKPCLPLKVQDQPPMFSGIANGGRMAMLDDHRLLVTVGDHELDGWRTPRKIAQEPDSYYGKTMLVDLRDGSSRVYSLGHRNQQGLYVAHNGAIWATEHGPQGGDELNLLREGANYGWPLATYGVEYGTHTWPLTDKPGSHEGFEQPFYSWIPSIGVSSLAEVGGPLFQYWRDDLLISSLAGNALWRLRIRDGRVVLTEQIPIGDRIRDILEGHNGELILWTDSFTLVFIEPGSDVKSGEALYSMCAFCHVSPTGQPHGVGPGLKNIVGRQIAAAADFPYSRALRDLKGTWTRERLDAFLADPRAMAPGTSMQFAGVKDADARKTLIDYLADPKNRLDVAPAHGPP